MDAYGTQLYDAPEVLVISYAPKSLLPPISPDLAQSQSGPEPAPEVLIHELDDGVPAAAPPPSAPPLVA